MDRNKIEQELMHDKHILAQAAEIWGWDTPAGRKRAERRAAYFVSQGAMSSGKKVLEIGCGTGIFTNKLSASGATIIAVDLSPDFIARAKQEVTAPNITFKVDDIHKLSFPDREFDVVAGSSVLHHLDLAIALKEINRVLKPGGILVLTEPNMLNPQIMIQKNIPWIKKLMGDSPGETAFFRWPLKKALLAAGFSNVQVKPFDFLHPQTPACCIGLVGKIGLAVEKMPLLREIAGSLAITAQK